MIITAHQPAYLPWLGFFHKIALSDIYVILDEVQFEKDSFINRNKIKTSNGAQWLTVPVYKAGYTNKSISQIQISGDEWKRKHWLNIYLNYKKAPYFNKYSEFFHTVYKEKWINLIDLLIHTMNFFLSEMNINTKVIKQSELQTKCKKEELIIELCKKLNADGYIFGMLGRNYADEEIFKDRGIKIYFQEYVHPMYTQLWGEFTPYMSIIDLLFNEGADNTLNILMENNISKKDLESLLNIK